jgi:hypothetical protein
MAKGSAERSAGRATSLGDGRAEGSPSGRAMSPVGDDAGRDARGWRDGAFAIRMLALVAALLVAYLCSFLIGSVDISVGEVVDILRSRVMPVEHVSAGRF